MMYHLSRFSALPFAFRPPNPPQGTEQMDTRILKRMKHKNDHLKHKRKQVTQQMQKEARIDKLEED